jgi:hypothetical protein|tara:strand:- start:138 stop:518 length:381 start_codon:yes stop_codon:yes gene_type:complete
MKHILTTLLICVSSFCFSQDTLHIPSPELEEFFLALDTLEVQDSIKTVLIERLEHEILLYGRLADQDSLIISYKDQEIVLLNEQIELHIDRLNQVDKWYKKPWVGFAGGFIGTIVLIHTIDYTLPQ